MVFLFVAVPMLTVIVGGAAGGVALVLCLGLSCVIGCWCCRSKQGESVSVCLMMEDIDFTCFIYSETKRRKKNARKGRLLGDDM